MRLFIIIIICLWNNFYPQPQDDPIYYTKITNTRTFLSIDNVIVTEYWFTRDKYCRVNPQGKTIVRNDIGVIYHINFRSGTYSIDSIKPQKTSLTKKTSASTGKKTIDLKYIGQSYIPEYEWNAPKLLSTETIGEYVCEHYLCEGDADFDQISLEFLLAKTDNQFMANMLNSTILNLTGSYNKREPIFKMINENKNLIPLRIIETIENSISPPSITRINIDKPELVKSSEGLFDLPDNLKKIN